MKRAALALLLAANTLAGTVTIQTTANTGRQVLVVFPDRGGLDADCDGDGARTVADFPCFVSRFVSLDLYGDADGRGGAVPFNVADFTSFLRAFAGGPVSPLLVTSGFVCPMNIGTTAEPVWVDHVVRDDHLGNAFPANDDYAAWRALPVERYWLYSVGADSTGLIRFDFALPGFLLREDGVSGRWQAISFN